MKPLPALTVAQLRPGTQVLLAGMGWVRVNSVDDAARSCVVGWRGGTRVLTEANLQQHVLNYVRATLRETAS